MCSFGCKMQWYIGRNYCPKIQWVADFERWLGGKRLEELDKVQFG